MKKEVSRTGAKGKIDEFFKKENFTAEEVKKIKRLAMRYNIKLGSYKKSFCKKCLNKLRGKIRISKEFKMIECEKCNYKNRFKLS